jgi:hypothetical protein
VENVTVADQINIYPNPINSSLQDLIIEGLQALDVIRVFDISGRIVLEEKVSNNGVFTLPYSQGLDNEGMYFIQVKRNNALVATKKLVVMK